MTTIDKRNKKFFTEIGMKTLTNRIKTYIRIFNEDTFPFVGQMSGFGKIEIESQKDCLSRILELTGLIGFQAKLNMNQATSVAKIEY